MERRRTKFYIKTVSISLIFLFILIYALFQARNLLLGPQITDILPETGARVSSSSIEITGATKNIKRLTLNDREIVMDEKGRFDEKLLIPKGYTIMKLQGWDRFKRDTTEFLEIFYTPLEN